MSATTSIEWTDKTWGPVRGCSLVSDGCRNCYAMKQAHRFSGPGKPYEGLTRLGPKGPTWTGQVRTVESALLEPLSWRKPARIFVNSMSDLFHEDVPVEFIAQVFVTMRSCERHTFQILTKRAERMRTVLTSAEFLSQLDKWTEPGWPYPLPNVWLGVSVENQHFADERIPLLLQTPAAVRFISAEPLLGPISIHESSFRCCRSPKCDESVFGLDWVIVGGESGPSARPFNLAWARSIIQQCKAAGVACFIKQLGAKPMMYSLGDVSQLHLSDRKGGDPSEWEADLKVRQFPEICA